MPKECDEQIDLVDYDLQEVSLETLRHFLSLTEDCADCDKCDGQKAYLRRLIAEKIANQG